MERKQLFSHINTNSLFLSSRKWPTGTRAPIVPASAGTEGLIPGLSNGFPSPCMVSALIRSRPFPQALLTVTPPLPRTYLLAISLSFSSPSLSLSFPLFCCPRGAVLPVGVWWRKGHIGWADGKAEPGPSEGKQGCISTVRSELEATSQLHCGSVSELSPMQQREEHGMPAANAPQRNAHTSWCPWSGSH